MASDLHLPDHHHDDHDDRDNDDYDNHHDDGDNNDYDDRDDDDLPPSLLCSTAAGFDPSSDLGSASQVALASQALSGWWR